MILYKQVLDIFGVPYHVRPGIYHPLNNQKIYCVSYLVHHSLMAATERYSYYLWFSVNKEKEAKIRKIENSIMVVNTINHIEIKNHRIQFVSDMVNGKCDTYDDNRRIFLTYDECLTYIVDLMQFYRTNHQINSILVKYIGLMKSFVKDIDIMVTALKRTVT